MCDLLWFQFFSYHCTCNLLIAGNDVIFLDPHTTQQIGFINNKDEEHEKKTDCSYHCQQASRLHILNMDPSVAVVSVFFLI